MTSTGKWFVMLNSQNGENITPLMTVDKNVKLWETREEALADMIDSHYAQAFGFYVYQVDA